MQLYFFSAVRVEERVEEFPQELLRQMETQVRWVMTSFNAVARVLWPLTEADQMR